METTPTSLRPAVRGAARRRRGLWLVSGLTALLLAGYFGLGLFVADQLTRPIRRPLDKTPALVGLGYKDVQFLARGGDVTISAWFIAPPPEAQGRRAVILVHGKDGCRMCEFQGGELPFTAALNKRGFGVLLIDLRGHGASGDARFTFGLNERRDIEGAVDWLRAQGFGPGSTGVLGISMGGASAIGAAAEEPGIGAVVTDSAYADFRSILEAEFPKASGLPGFFLPAVTLSSRVFLGSDIESSRPVDEIGRIAPRPVLIIHAAGDPRIPKSHAERLAAAYPAAQLWLTPAQDHTYSYAADPQGYTKRVADFFAASLN